MRTPRLLFSLMLMACVAVFYSCKEEEVEKPIENTERTDALRAELRALQLQVLGATHSKDTAKASEESLKTQIAALKNQYNQKVTYTVRATNTRGEALEGVAFSVAQAGSKVTKTSDASGVVVFDNMRGGIVTGTVNKEGYTIANFTASLVKENQGNDEDINNSYSITTIVPLLPAPGSNNENEMYTIEGMAYANFSYVNDTLEESEGGVNRNNYSINYDIVKDKKIKAILNLTELPKTNINGTDNSLIRLSYDNAVYEAVVDAAGKFTLKLPAKSIYDQGFPFTLALDEFVAEIEDTEAGFSSTDKTAPKRKYTQVYRFYPYDYSNYAYPYSILGWHSGMLNTSMSDPGQVISTRLFYSENNY